MADLHENGSRIKNMMASDTSSSTHFDYIRNSIQFKHGMYFSLCTIIFFQCVNWIIKSQGPPKALRHEEWKWRNLYVSWIHAIFCSIWTLSSLLLYPEMWHNVENLLTYINQFSYFNVCFAFGYFVYDFIDMIIYNKVLVMWEVTLHHFAVAGMFYYNIYIKSNIGFNLIALCVEVNSVFLHWRKLLQMNGTSFSSKRYIIIKYVNLLSFAIFRFGPLIAITTTTYYWRLKVSIAYYVCLIISMIFMDVLNIILFKRLFKSDVLRSFDGSSSSLLESLKRDAGIVFNNAIPDNQTVGVNNNVSKPTDETKKE